MVIPVMQRTRDSMIPRGSYSTFPTITASGFLLINHLLQDRGAGILTAGQVGTGKPSPSRRNIRTSGLLSSLTVFI